MLVICETFSRSCCCSCSHLSKLHFLKYFGNFRFLNRMLVVSYYKSSPRLPGPCVVTSIYLLDATINSDYFQRCGRSFPKMPKIFSQPFSSLGIKKYVPIQSRCRERWSEEKILCVGITTSNSCALKTFYTRIS